MNSIPRTGKLVLMRFRGLVLSLLLAACQNDQELAVDVRTDLVPGREFDRVVVSLDGAPVDPVAVSAGDDFGSPHRVAEIRGVASGRRLLRVALALGDDEVVARRVSVRMEGSLILLVVLARDCRGVICPGSGDDAGETECLGGRCVDPDCTTVDPASCGDPECTSDPDCSTDTACTTARCAEGVCLEVARAEGEPGACADGELCLPSTGCVPADERVDAGALDAGELDAGPIDAGPSDAGPSDAGPSDAGPSDAGRPDSGPPDAGPECVVTADCDDPIVSPWTDCAGFAGACDASGTQTQTTRTFACVLGACVPTDTPATRACARTTEGTACGSGGTCCAEACVQTATDESHCCGCGMPCDPPFATGSCVGSACGVGSCDAGRLDCTAASGCESSATALTSCGGCGIACGANETCLSGGVCQCGTVTGAPGGGAACADALPNATGACGASTPRGCVVTACDAGFGNCDGAPANGCEVALATSPTHCGACGRACGAGETCVSGTCRCNGGAACAAAEVCRPSCGCSPATETICTNVSPDEDCDGLRNCEDPDCDLEFCGGGAGVRSCSGGACVCECPGCVDPCF